MATLVPLVRQARASGENLNYITLAPQARQARPSGEILNYLLSHYSYILSMIIGSKTQQQLWREELLLRISDLSLINQEHLHLFWEQVLFEVNHSPTLRTFH